MGEGRLELLQEYRESGFDGKYERTTHYTLLVDDEQPTATLEIAVVKQTFPNGPERRTVTRYKIGREALVSFIQKEGTRAE